MPQCLAVEIRQQLGLSAKEFNELVRQGLPRHKKAGGKEWLCDEEAVFEWLVDNGHAEIDEPIVLLKREEAATYWGVPTAEIKTWELSKGFPGKRNHYPIDEINEWIEQRRRQNEPRQSLYDLVRAKRQELMLAKETAEVVPLEIVNRFIARTNAWMVSELNTIPAIIESQLPSGIDESLRLGIRSVIVNVIAETCNLIASRYVDDKDEDEGEDEE